MLVLGIGVVYLGLAWVVRTIKLPAAFTTTHYLMGLSWLFASAPILLSGNQLLLTVSIGVLALLWFIHKYKSTESQAIVVIVQLFVAAAVVGRLGGYTPTVFLSWAALAEVVAISTFAARGLASTSNKTTSGI